MAGEGFQIGLQIGDRIGSAIKAGVAEWREIQRERQERREFEGALALDEQRRLAVLEQTTPRTRGAYEEAKAMLRRYPNPERVERPIPGAAREDGSLETEEVIRTPEGEIPVAMLQQFDVNEREAFFRRQKAETDRILQFQARLPENRFAKEYVAGQFAGLQREQQLFLTKFKAQQQEVELYTARANLERAQLERQRLQGEDERLAAADKRARELKTFETNERVRGDLAIAEGKAKFEPPKGIDPFQRQILVDTYKQGGKDIDAAQASIDTLSQIDSQLERAEQVLAAGGVDTGAIAGGAVGSRVQRLTNEENLNVVEQAFGAEFLQAVQSMRGLGQLSDRDAQALTRTTGGIDKDEKFNLADLRRRRSELRKILARKAQERDIAVRNREAVLKEGGYSGVIQTKGRAPEAPTGVEVPAAGAPEVPEQSAGAAVPPPVAPELFEDAAAVRRAFREGRISRDEAVRRIAEMGE